MLLSFFTKPEGVLSMMTERKAIKTSTSAVRNVAFGLLPFISTFS
jgi:hypothetical protein